ncbi:MAG: hypothetical protein ABI844_11720, partial [Saprospiraceae bacterium]
MKNVICLIFLFIMGMGNIFSQVPGTFNVQGVLTNLKNEAVPDGSYNITFRIYSAELSDIPLWSESHANVQVQNGIFSVLLGSIIPFNIPFDKPYFLGIKSGNDAEMTPRIALSSNPYSLMAKNMEDNSISTQKIQANAVTVDKIVPNIISRINGVSNDGGNIQFVAGANVSILSDDINKTVTISSINSGSGGSAKDYLPGKNISILNINTNNPEIALKDKISLGPNGTLETTNGIGLTVSRLSYNVNGGGFLQLFNDEGTELFKMSSGENKQGRFRMSNRLGNPTGDIFSNDFSDGEIQLYNVLTNPTLRFTANEFGGGLINVFNPSKLTAIEISTASKGNGKIILNNNAGQELLYLGKSLNEGGFLELSNDLQKKAIRLTTNSNGDGTIHIYNNEGNAKASLSTNEGNGGIIGVNNSEGTQVARLTTTADNQGIVEVKNRLGNTIGELLANEFSDGQLNLNSALNNPTLRFTANDNAGGLINVFNQGGKIAARLTEEEGGKFSIFNTDETEMIQLSTLPNRTARIRVNNRLGNPAADLISNDFSDGQLTLSSVNKNPTVVAGANNDAGGLINVFNKNAGVAARLTEVNGDGEFKIFNKQNIDVVSVNSILGDGEVILKNKPGFEAAGIVGSSLGGFIYVADGTKNTGLNFRGILNGGVGGGELELYNSFGIKTFLLTTNYNYEGL